VSLRVASIDDNHRAHSGIGQILDGAFDCRATGLGFNRVKHQVAECDPGKLLGLVTTKCFERQPRLADSRWAQNASYSPRLSDEATQLVPKLRQPCVLDPR